MAGETQTREFTWVETDEPHASRRKAILKAHPEIKALFAKEPRTFWIVLGVLIAQIGMASFMSEASWPVLLFFAYVFGGTANHSMQLAAHELSHNLCFEKVLHNQLLAIMANLCTGVPSAMTFFRYHMEHHMFQGVDGIDTDVPTTWECGFFTNSVLKCLWMFLQPAFYALRPLAVKPKTPQFMELVNYAACFSFDYLIYQTLGGKALAYLVIGSLLGLGLHPTAGHFIAEHYEFTKGTETYSYYGSCNYVNFNVGYHMEHHDFPKIPWSRLPQVKEIAPEFYNNLPHYDSYIKVIWKYITDPDIGPHSRVKRKEKYSIAKKTSKKET